MGDGPALESGPPSAGPLLAAESLSKTFGTTRALDGVSLQIAPGEVHGLLGQNGSGKSTFIKVLAGYVVPDAGSLRIRGEDVALPLAPAEVSRLGISFVHQDLGLVDTLSVLDNLRIRRYETGYLRRIHWRAERRRARDLLARFGVSVDPHTPVRQLPHTTKAVIAVMRALQDFERLPGGGLLVLDEPTASLPQHEVDILFDVVRRIRDAGSSVLFVTHRVNEVLTICDSVSILRDGKHVTTETAAALDERKLIRLIVGRDVGEFFADHPPDQTGEVALVVEDMAGSVVRDASFAVRRGEIVGLTGLIGAGHDEVPYLLFGASTGAGRIRVGGRTVTHPSPPLMKRLGLGFLPADRQRLGGIQRATVRENITLATLRRYRGRLLRVRRGVERQDVAALIQRLDVHPAAPDRLFWTLSGGNQQKALLGRWLHAEPSVLVLHEPTQGVDVGSRQRIFAILRASADGGTAILYSSAEHEDLAHVCDRVLIFHRGRITRELRGPGLDPNAIADACYHVEPEVAA